MSIVFGSRALRLLARKKLVGRVRSHLRRLRRPSGIVLGLLGLGIFGVWIVAIQLSSGQDTSTRDPAELVPLVRLGALFLTLFTVGSSMTHRGLFMPREEIERLLSAPLSRADIVRYRLLSGTGRSLFAGVVFGLILMARMPDPLFAFIGLLVAMQTLPVVGQAAAILAGGLEKRSVRRLRGWPGGILRIACFVLGMIVFLVLAFGGAGENALLRELPDLLSEARFQAVFDHPTVRAITIPFEPWARAITATDATTFIPWIAVCTVLWALLFEFTARLPIDFRELSLETSANVAERIRRHRRVGGGASAAKVSRVTVSWRLPWMFGRGPVGAIAWRKTTAIVRKARGTLLVSVFVLAMVTLLVASISRAGGRQGILGGAALIVFAGTLYLSAGLRFDFREDLDRMETIKAWPQRPSRIFTATILPEVILIAVMVIGGIVVRAAATRAFDPWLGAVVVAVPLFVFAWIALDNAVFLFAPIRFVAGQEGAMQNAGRAVILMALRGLLLAVIAIAVGLGFGGFQLAAEHLLDLPGSGPLVAGVVGGLLSLLGCDVALVAIGSSLFRRFDVARQRG